MGELTRHDTNTETQKCTTWKEFASEGLWPWSPRQNRLHFRAHRMLCFIRRDLRLMLKRQPDIVQPVQQTMARKLIHRERRRESSSVFRLKRFEIDRELVVSDLFRAARDLRHLLFVEPHRQ